MHNICFDRVDDEDAEDSMIYYVKIGPYFRFYSANKTALYP